MSFNILYQNGGDATSHLTSIAVYLDSFAKGLGVDAVNIDAAKLNSVAAALLRPDFPHIDGLEKASPFKKAANFFVWFVAERPIIQPLAVEMAGKELTSIPNHQNVIMAYKMCARCLLNAKLYKKNGNGIEEEFVLTNPIKVSRHFFCDFVATFSAAVPAYHFHVVSLLFEQLAYKANPKASYPEVV